MYHIYNFLYQLYKRGDIWYMKNIWILFLLILFFCSGCHLKNHQLHKRKFLPILITSCLFLKPLAFTNINGLGSKIGQKKIKAEEVATINILQQIEANGGNVNRTDFKPTTFDLSMESLGLLNVDLVNPTLHAQFQADEFRGNIVDGGTATVTLEILPITKENLPGLYHAINGITDSVTTLTNEIGDLVAELESISEGILQVNGLTEVIDALNALNNLETSLESLTAYKQEIPVTVSNDSGILTIEYGDGLGQHMESTINDVVIELLDDLVRALDSLEIKLIEGGINSRNIIELVKKLENLPLLGRALSPLMGDGVLGQILKILGGILDRLLEPLLGPAVEAVVDILEDLINGLLDTAANLAVEVTDLADNLTDNVLNITDGLAALRLIGGVNIEIKDIQVAEEVTDLVDVRVLAVEEPVIDVSLFSQQGISTEVDFGLYEEIFTFKHVPPTLSFKPTEITGEFVRIPREEPDWAIVIEDTRRNENQFRVTAQISEPLTSENGQHQLLDALVFVDENGKSTALEQTPIDVFTLPFKSTKKLIRIS